MPIAIDPGLIAIFGSENRALTLATLANASEPLTGYRIARVSGAQPIKVYAELRRLAKAGVVAETPIPGGRRGWTVKDSDLRNLFRRRARISWEAEWNRRLTERIEAQPRLKESNLRIDMSRYRPDPSSVPNRAEFERPPEKDGALVVAGLRPSSRRRRVK